MKIEIKDVLEWWFQIKMKLILLLGLCILILVSGCVELITVCDLGWKNETHFCNEFHNVERIPIELNDESPEAYQPIESLFGYDNDIYCYQDNQKSIHCTCDIIIYPDGYNETKNCNCWNDLVMHYTCINKTEENITIIDNVQI